MRRPRLSCGRLRSSLVVTNLHAASARSLVCTAAQPLADQVSRRFAAPLSPEVLVEAATPVKAVGNISYTGGALLLDIALSELPNLHPFRSFRQLPAFAPHDSEGA
mmetsp:Transcript_47510/g.127197  ORF Transcript_47510/g.127197 Transcript_47510/m.127197 type:complete len:106 (-) Transcript_47510:50-367(-)